MKNYSGADLGEDYKVYFRKMKRKISKILKDKGCTDIKMSMQFYYFYGFFTSPSGQVYYFSQSDVRHFPDEHKRLLIRTAKDYKDFTGGPNQYCEIDSLVDFHLR
jgi:hypothetical protein